LAGSEPNVNYTLYRNGLALSPTYQGTGSALSFGVQTEGTYSVTGNRNDCNNINLVSAMTGSAVVTMTSTVGGTVSGPDTAIEGITQVNLALTSNTGNVLMWQKRLNSGDWIDIPNTATSYLEIPAQPGNWEYKALVQNGSCPVKSSASHLVVVSGRTLTVKIFLQGLYNTTSGLMNKARDENRDHFPGNIADRISLKLANSNYPYTILYSIQEIPLLTNGYCTIELPPGSVSSYYLVVNHRNSVETWSAVPLNLAAANISFDFTDSANKAYGDTLVFSGGIWEIYSGDLTQDGIVDLDDLIAIDNQNNIFAAGYLDEDLNGDGLVDSSDMILAWNNSDLFIARVTP
jgi:hypothetical protein